MKQCRLCVAHLVIDLFVHIAQKRGIEISFLPSVVKGCIIKDDHDSLYAVPWFMVTASDNDF